MSDDEIIKQQWERILKRVCITPRKVTVLITPYGISYDFRGTEDET